jgi:hypothetical protein
MNIIPVLKALIIMAPTNNARYYLESVHVIKNENDFELITSDGQSILSVTMTNNDRFIAPVGTCVTLCVKSLKEAVSLVSKQEVTLEYDCKTSSVTLCDMPVSTIDCNYPRTAHFFKESSRGGDPVGIDFKKLAKMSRACNILSGVGVMTVQAPGKPILFKGHGDKHSYRGVIAPMSL